MYLKKIQLALVLVSTCFLPTIALAQSLSNPNSSGDYTNRGHHRWIVTDPDSNGLNCRWSSAIPQNQGNFDQSIRMNVREWNIVRRFPQGTVLIATSRYSPAGFVIVYDEDRKPWIQIGIGAGNEICLVRANSAYIRPIQDPQNP